MFSKILLHCLDIYLLSSPTLFAQFFFPSQSLNTYRHFFKINWRKMKQGMLVEKSKKEEKKIAINKLKIDFSFISFQFWFCFHLFFLLFFHGCRSNQVQLRKGFVCYFFNSLSYLNIAYTVIVVVTTHMFVRHEALFQSLLGCIHIFI